MVKKRLGLGFLFFSLFINLPGYCRLGKESDSDPTAEIEMIHESVFVGTRSGRHVDGFEKRSAFNLRNYPLEKCEGNYVTTIFI